MGALAFGALPLVEFVDADMVEAGAAEDVLALAVDGLDRVVARAS